MCGQCFEMLVKPLKSVPADEGVVVGGGVVGIGAGAGGGAGAVEGVELGVSVLAGITVSRAAA